jgi:hypothetical protein
MCPSFTFQVVLKELDAVNSLTRILGVAINGFRMAWP